MHSITRRLVTPLALALFLAGAGSAHASLLVAPGEDCNQYTSSQVFLQWADIANYTLAPGGDFENAASQTSWDTTNASRVTTDNESYYVGSPNDHSSLAIAGGGSATSPAMCVGLQNPTLRVFYKRTSGSTLSTLRVEALFVDAYGNTQSLTIGTLGGSYGAWTLSPQMVIGANLLPLLSDGTPVAFRFSAYGGTFQIDDAYVDPWGKG